MEKRIIRIEVELIPELSGYDVSPFYLRDIILSSVLKSEYLDKEIGKVKFIEW